MRLSPLGSACTTAVLSTILTLPLLAQPAPKNVTIQLAGIGTSSLRLHCKDVKDLSQCVDGAQGLSPQEMKRLKAMTPKLQKQLDEELSKAQDRSGTCFTMRVFEFPKGFPDKNAKAQPKVSECTPASRFHERGLVQGVQIYQTKKPR